MKPWSAFYPDVLPELPGAPQIMVDHYLRNAAIEFCERSKALVVDLSAFDSAADQMSYTVPVTADTELVEVVSAWYAGEKLTARARAYLDRKYDDWTLETGTPEHFTQQDLVAVSLVPAPDAIAIASIKLKVAIKPGTAADGVDDWLFSGYRLALAAGAKAKMMAMDKVEWASPDRAGMYAGQFEEAVSKATVAANNGFGRARPRFSGSFC